MKTKSSFTRFWASLALTVCAFLLGTVAAMAAVFPTVKGTVVDETGEPVIGVSILVKGTTNGTVTDLDGNFVVTNVNSGSTLVFSYVGYKTQEIKVTQDKTPLKVVLAEDSEVLEDVVVVGYATMRKKDLTGSIIQIKAGDKDNQAPASVQDILRNTPGMNIGMSNDAKGGGDIQIRGERSMSEISKSAPMLVLDGMPFYGELSEINPEDIGQIDILKDASAAAVYGSQAANGVIIITTKKGKQGKPTINFSTKLGLVDMTNFPKYMNADQYLQFSEDYMKTGTYGFNPATGKYEAYQNGRQTTPGYYEKPTNLPSGLSLSQWREYSKAEASMSDNEVYFRRILPMVDPMVMQNYLNGKSMDWFDYATRTGVNQDYNVSVSGASDKANYYISLGYLDNKGTRLGDDYSAIRANMKVNTQVTNWLEVGGNVNFQRRSDDALPIGMTGSWSQNVLVNSPYDSMYDANGNLEPHPHGVLNSSRGYNYAYNMQFQKKESGYTILNTILDMKLKLPFNITYTLNYMPRMQWYFNREFHSTDHIDWDAANYGTDRSNTSKFEWSMNQTVNWDYYLKEKHHFTVTLVQEAERHESWLDMINARNIAPTDALQFHYIAGAGKLESNFTNTDTYETGVGYLARLFYSFDDRYMITASMRRDGYSAFGQDVPYANFPSLATAWTFTNEKFWKWDTMSMGKLRLSWGQNGNRALTDPYIALASLMNGGTTFPYLTTSGSLLEQQFLMLDRMANPKLKWERSESLNLALDFGFLDNRITGSLEAYTISTKDMILNRTLPGFTGFKTIATNLGEVNNKGIELTLNTQNIKKKNFSWNTSFNISLNDNKIKHLYNEYDENGKEKDDIANQWFIGHSIGEIWNFDVTGIYQPEEAAEAALLGLKPGDVKVRNVYTEDDKINADGTRTPVYNDNDKVFLGRTDYPVMWSLNNTVNWKNFEFSLNVSSKMGAKYRDTYYQNSIATYQIENGENFVARNYWTPENGSNKVARICAELPAGAAGTGMIKDMSFIRFENVSLAYMVPKSVYSKLGIANVKVYVTGRNLGVIRFSDWKFGDPETHSWVNRTFTFGLNVTL